jgi:ribA/ribD-fused uncharacterized protein
MIAMFDGKYAFLSNFYPSPITFNGITFPTVENWFQAWKTENPTEFQAIATADTPGKSKRLGRHCTLRKDWEEIKTDVMMRGLRLKFQDPKLRAMLLATGNEELIEGNTWHDNTWGNCVCQKCQNTPGRNMLGMLLMELRTEIRYEVASHV